jgi:hypothetical protein
MHGGLDDRQSLPDAAIYVSARYILSTPTTKTRTLPRLAAHYTPHSEFAESLPVNAAPRQLKVPAPKV